MQAEAAYNCLSLHITILKYISHVFKQKGQLKRISTALFLIQDKVGQGLKRRKHFFVKN